MRWSRLDPRARKAFDEAAAAILNELGLVILGVMLILGLIIWAIAWFAHR